MAKKPMLSLFAHVGLLSLVEEHATLPQQKGIERQHADTLHVCLEYTTLSWGAHVLYQLQGSYKTRFRTQKWWHMLFSMFLEVTIYQNKDYTQGVHDKTLEGKTKHLAISDSKRKYLNY